MSIRSQIKDIVLDHVTNKFRRVVGKYQAKDTEVASYGEDEFDTQVKTKALEEGLKHVNVYNRRVGPNHIEKWVEYYIIDHEELREFVNLIVDTIHEDNKQIQ